MLDALESLQDGDSAAACNGLAAVMNEIEAQAGKAITEAQAATLLADLEQIRAVLGC